MHEDYIFVYGTLRRDPTGSMYHLLARYTDFIGDGYINGKLYEIEDYPGLIISSSKDERVYGEVYRIRDSKYVFEILDDYEECREKYPEPHEYKRVKADIHLGDGRMLKAWVYEFNHPVTTHKLIKSGNYVEYVKDKI